MTTISECFVLPDRESITALGFVVSLDDDESAERQRIDDYVITPKVGVELPAIFSALRHAYRARSDAGRFIHGSFGSGKSHFLSFIGLLLEGREAAWQKPDPAVAALQEHRAWIAEASLLVVRLHMLTAAGTTATTFDRTVYEAVNRALLRRGKRPFEFLNVEGVLTEARNEAVTYGAQFWHRLEQAEIVGGQAEFEALANGNLEEREQLARAYLTWKGRDAASAGVDPNWAQGLQRLTAHLRSEGIGGLVLLVDEFLLWLREKSGPEFERAINQLNVIVDHNDGARAVPVFVFVARQRRISDFFPDIRDDNLLHEHLGHHSKRFEETSLEDVELRHVCKGRVLRRRPEHAAEVERVVASLVKDQAKLLPAILQNADVAYLKDVYPFHPALIEMLIDVSALMQRDRTALRLLYELLVIHYPTLPLGKLLPVGAAFEAIFPRVGVDASNRGDDLREIHRLYYERVKPAMDQMRRFSGGNDGDFDDARLHVLDMAVKTVLLCEVSPRLKGIQPLTVERIVRLNDSEITGETDRSKFSRVAQDLLDLHNIVTELQISGTGKDAVVGVVLRGVNFGAYLQKARSRVQNNRSQLLKVFKDLVLAPALGRKPESFDKTYEPPWRYTRRKGTLVLDNVRTRGASKFAPEPGHEFRIVIDYPWDDDGYTIVDDENRARDLRKRENMATLCWLPRHFTPAESEYLRDLAAVEEILGPAQSELLGDLSKTEKDQVLELAGTRRTSLQLTLQQKLGELYRDHGKVIPLIGTLDGTVLRGELKDIPDRLVEALLDQQFPQHPPLKIIPTIEMLRRLATWLGRAVERGSNQPLDFTDDEETAEVLRKLGEPLELVQLGSTRGTLRLDTRYIKMVRDGLKADTSMWDPIDRKLADTYALQPAVRNLLLDFVIRLESLRPVNHMSGETMEIRVESTAIANVRLVRAPRLGLAEWSRARELGPALFDDLAATEDICTLAAQDRYAKALSARAKTIREQLQGFHGRLAAFAANEGPRAVSIREAIARLAPLVSDKDSFAALTEWLAKWPGESGDPIRGVVHDHARARTALDRLDETVWRALRRGGGALAGEAEAHCATLQALLNADDVGGRLDDAAINRWNLEGRALLDRIVEQTPPPVQTPPVQPPPPPPGREVFTQVLRPRDPAAIEAFTRTVGSRLTSFTADEVDIEVVITPRRRST